MFGVDWIKTHVTAVSGAYGKNIKLFNTKSDSLPLIWAPYFKGIPGTSSS